VRLTFNGVAVAPPAPPERAVLTFGDEVKGVLPAIGLSVAGHEEGLSESEAKRLAALRLRHLRVDVDLRAGGDVRALAQSAAQAEALGCGIALAVFVDDGWRRQLEALAEGLADSAARVTSCLLLHPGGPGASAGLLPGARRLLSEACPRARFGVGSNANFTELNRNRPPLEGLDFISFAANPQVHAFDDMSIMETPDGLGWAVRTARHFAGGLPVVISPLTLRPRFSAVATVEEKPTPNALPPQVDPRQVSLLAAAWTVGCLRSSAESGADAVTLFETTGRRGIMEAGDGSPMPELFPSLPGCVFPVYHVLAALKGIAHGRVLAVESSRPLDVQALAVEQLSGVRLLVANMTDGRTVAELRGLASAACVKLLDERNAERAMREPEEFVAEPPDVVECAGGRLELELLPYALAVIDLVEEPGA
jgi:hypothetical protein